MPEHRVEVTYPDGTEENFPTLDEAIEAAKEHAAGIGGGFIFVRGPDDEIDQAIEVKPESRVGVAS